MFALHDADPHGYNIAHTLAEETKRILIYSAKVIDLGFKLEEALDMGRPTKTFTHKNALPSDLKLSVKEFAYFFGRPSGKFWICERVELNALQPFQHLKYVDARLKEHGTIAKVIPPAGVIAQAAQAKARAVIRDKPISSPS